MAKVVGISGSQGAGKSSLLSALITQGHHVDAFKVSRAVQSQLGWTSLDRVTESFEVMARFQDEVFNQKLLNDITLKDSDKPVIFTERTFGDIYAYTRLWTDKLVTQRRVKAIAASTFLFNFHKKCVKAQADCYTTTVVVPMMPHLKFEFDLNRASENDIPEMYRLLMEFLGVDTYVITQKSIDDRVTETINFLKYFLEEVPVAQPQQT